MIEFKEHTIENSEPEAKKILQNIKEAYGFVPNLFSYMVEAPVTVVAYLEMNKLISQSSLSASEAQIALLAVSTENNCGFCSVAHTALAKANDVKPQTVSAIVNNGNIECKKDAALVKFTKLMVQKRGTASNEEVSEFIAAGYTKKNVFEVILIIAIKTLSNYSNHLTHPTVNKQLLDMI
jgi:uncharacterized peroxidase-related enzyme